MGHRVYKIRLRLWSRQLIVLLKCCTYLNIERDRGLWRDEIRKTLWNFICDTQNFQFCEVSMQFVNQHRSARYVESSFQFIAWKKSNDRTSWTNEIGDLKKKKNTGLANAGENNYKHSCLCTFHQAPDTIHWKWISIRWEILLTQDRVLLNASSERR